MRRIFYLGELKRVGFASFAFDDGPPLRRALLSRKGVVDVSGLGPLILGIKTVKLPAD